VSQTDFEASFARLLGITLPSGAAPDSKDVLDALLGKSQVGRQELVEHRMNDDLALRDGQWKFIHGELYDLSKDLSETKNLAKEQPARAAAMAARVKELKAEKTSK
jgi:arylsulfatase A-like enzyme